MSRTLPALLVIFAAGCAVRAPQTYRLIDGRTLVPPGVAGDAVVRRTYIADIRPGGGKCMSDPAVELKPRGHAMRVTVNREALAHQPRGWLSRWSASAESEGCIAPGEGLKLAESIVESVPLEAGMAFGLLHPSDREAGYVDLGPEVRIQVNSPIMREGSAPGADPIESSRIVGLTVEVKTSPDLLGFETAWYAVRSKAAGIGYTVSPISAERHIQGKTEATAAPLVNYFPFASQAAYYRLFYKTDQGVTRILVVGSASRSELDRASQGLNADPGSCAKMAAGTCVLLPQHVAANPNVVALVNGREVLVPVGSGLRAAIQAAGEKDPKRVLPSLTVKRPFGGRLAPVEFDRSGAGILDLSLHGGEEIAWSLQP